jgi:hypothetical protein
MYLQIVMDNSVFAAFGLNALCKPALLMHGIKKAGTSGNASDSIPEVTVSNLGEDIGYTD